MLGWILPSKLRLPDKTPQHTKLLVSIAAVMFSWSGPVFKWNKLIVYLIFFLKLTAQTWISNASTTSITHHVKSKFFQKWYYTRFLQVIRDHTWARWQWCFYVWCHFQSHFYSILGQHASAKHHRWIGCVGAGCYCSNYHGSMRDFVVLSIAESECCFTF